MQIHIQDEANSYGIFEGQNFNGGNSVSLYFTPSSFVICTLILMPLTLNNLVNNKLNLPALITIPTVDPD
jgi:hypothetical protein